MDDLRERRKNSPKSGAERNIPIINLNQRRQNLDYNFEYKHLIYLIPALILSFVLIYGYFFSSTINPNFFKYGHPSDKSWKQNNLLEKADKISTKLKGPEAIAFSSDGYLYTGLANGIIIRIDQNNQTEKILQIGDELDERVCDNLKYGHLAEPPCGRPFGLRFKPNTDYLYIADSFIGIVKVDVSNKSKTILLSAKDKRFGDRPLRLIEDLDLDDDGNIYFVDSSYEHDLNEAILDIINPTANGRLYRYNERSDELVLLSDNLYFPNGVQLTPSHDALLISEFSMARIIRYHLTGQKKGKTEVFTELPGLSDAIRLTEHNTLLVPFVIVFPTSPSITNILGRFALYRTTLGYFLTNEQILNILPKYGLVAEFDLKGNILKSWHDKTGKVIDSVSNAVFYDNKIYMGSFNKDFISVINYDS